MAKGRFLDEYAALEGYYVRRIPPWQAAQMTRESLHFCHAVYAALDKKWPALKNRAYRPEKPIDSKPHRG